MKTTRVIATSFVVALTCFRAAPAAACGGTFCDTGPQAMPVDQSGENILFVMDGQNVEAHVQIQYQGSAERFAWIVPMQAIPTVEVGSQLLFQNLLQGTVPTYGVLQQPDACGNLGMGGATSAGGSGGGGGFGGSGGDAGGPTVVFNETVGAFQVVVLQGGTAQEVSDWLVNNNYQTIPNAPSILQDYVAKGYVFVAIKLTAGASVDEIHPLVFRYAGTEPCVPLKLTAVAATEDMGVRTFFLGDDRVVPENYKHIELNPVRVNWQLFGNNYVQAVSRGADSAVANGKAFVTEYAGASNVVSPSSVYSPAWDYTPFQTIAPEQVVNQLMSEGLMFCSGSNFCQYNHPLVQPLLNEYLPVPTGVDENAFYACLDCYKAQIDPTKWDAAKFSADFKARIEDPGKHAQSLLTKWPYLTRMFTTISPTEMTEDPIFRAQPGLPTVQPNQQATLRTTCDGQQGMILPDGREVALEGFGWPAWDSLMPWVEEIAEYPKGGQKIVLVDNTDKINALLAEWNQAHGWPPVDGGGGVGGAGVGGNTTGSGGSGTGGSSSVSPGGGGGCNLGGNAPLTGGTLLLGAWALAAARRRRFPRTRRDA